MKKPDSYSASSDRPTGRHIRSMIAMAAIGIGTAAGYHCGHSARDTEVDELHAIADNKAKQLELKAHQLEQAQASIKQSSRSRQRINSRLSAAEGLAQNPDEAQCVDVVQRALMEKVNLLTGLLGITNQSDIDKLRNAMQKGYTKVMSIAGDGSQLYLIDPDAPEDSWNETTFIDLEEPVEQIPEEFLSEYETVEKSSAELEMEQKIADGKLEDVVNEFDLESLRPEDADPNSEDAVMHQAAVDLQKDLASTTDPDQRAAYFCDFFGKLMQYELSQDPTEDNPDDDSDEPMSPSDIQQSRLLSSYLEAVQKYVGIEDEDSCFSYVLNKPSHCPPCPQ